MGFFELVLSRITVMRGHKTTTRCEIQAVETFRNDSVCILQSPPPLLCMCLVRFDDPLMQGGGEGKVGKGKRDVLCVSETGQGQSPEHRYPQPITT